jgi:hypothetical protein
MTSSLEMQIEWLHCPKFSSNVFVRKLLPSTIALNMFLKPSTWLYTRIKSFSHQMHLEIQSCYWIVCANFIRSFNSVHLFPEFYTLCCRKRMRSLHFSSTLINSNIVYISRPLRKGWNYTRARQSQPSTLFEIFDSITLIMRKETQKACR